MLNTVFGGIIKSVISFYRIKETLVQNHTSKQILIFLTHCWLLIVFYSTLNGLTSGETVNYILPLFSSYPCWVRVV